MPSPAEASIYNFLRLTPRITTSGMPQSEELDLIYGLGTEVVITLVPEGVGNDIAGEAELVTQAGLVFERIPVIFKAPSLENFKCFCGLMAQYADRVCHVHCEANMRVSVFMALYRLVVHNWAEGDAMAPVAEIWKPNETWQHFIQTVLENRDQF